VHDWTHAAVRRRKIHSPRLQPGGALMHMDVSPRSGRQKSVCRPLPGLARNVVTFPPPEGGGYGSFAANGGLESFTRVERGEVRT
jgi:hypothetical protein